MFSASRIVDPAAVENLEFQLRSSLRPVRPNPEFVNHLHVRLTTSPQMTLERRKTTAVSLLLVALSLMSGVFLIWWMRHMRSIGSV
jgi:hypothetical protein